MEFPLHWQLVFNRTSWVPVSSPKWTVWTLKSKRRRVSVMVVCLVWAESWREGEAGVQPRDGPISFTACWPRPMACWHSSTRAQSPVKEHFYELKSWNNMVVLDQCVAHPCYEYLMWFALFCCLEGMVPYEGPGVELPYPPLDDTDPLVLLQLQHRYRGVCLALKHTLR